MTSSPAARFYKEAAASKDEREPGGFTVTLDGRPVKTPGGQPLRLPTLALAEAIAAEWAGQGEKILPATMPEMQLACTAIDRVGPHRAAVVDETSGYGGSDLLCYRTEEPQDLVDLQAAEWQPVLDWLAHDIGAKLSVTAGIVHVAQSDVALAALKDAVGGLDDFELTALTQITQVCGSLSLGLAVERGNLEWQRAVKLSVLDETYQAEKWGDDKEAIDRRRAMTAEVEAAARFLRLVRDIM